MFEPLVRPYRNSRTAAATFCRHKATTQEVLCCEKKVPRFCSDKYLQPQKNSRLVDPTPQVALAAAKFTSIAATESKSSFVAAKLFFFLQSCLLILQVQKKKKIVTTNCIFAATKYGSSKSGSIRGRFRR